jgi:glutamyl-tRNA synthetase
MTDVRTRFAPSPTGLLHVGGVRTALFAWLVARQANGQFILRIEDTDQAREVEGSAQHLITSLKALGITYDEGPDIGGPYAPYLQSQRLDSYKRWAQTLIDNGRAYADPYSTEEIQLFREEAKAAKKAFLYRDHRPDSLDIESRVWDGTVPLRFKSEPKSYEWHDEVMGDLHSGPEVIDDIILIKSDGFPTYNFAHIIDDTEMKISHVIRGQEFLSSQPNYLNIYEALDISRPIFATMPHILGESGNKKLGKRDGAKDVLDYLRDGYLPETMINFIASLGWNDGTEQEIFTRDELIKKFSLERVQKSGARFDEQRLLWMNGQHIRALSLDDLYERVSDFWPKSAHNATIESKKQVLSLVQDRLKTLADLPTITDYFFTEPVPHWSMLSDNKQLSKLSNDDIKDLLIAAKDALQMSTFDPDSVQRTLNTLLDTTGQKPGILFSLIRLAVSWAPFSPVLHETLSVIGKARTIARLDQTLDSQPHN